MRCIGNHFLHYALYLRKLRHQVHLGMQTTGSVNNNYINIVIGTFFYCIKCNRRWISVHTLRNDRYANSFTPKFKLIYGCCAKRIGCSKQYFFALLFELRRKFSNCGGLSDTIYSHHHDDIGFLICRCFEFTDCVNIIFRQQRSDLFFQDPVQFRSAEIFVTRYALLNAFNDLQRGTYANIRRDQNVFKIVEDFIVNGGFSDNVLFPASRRNLSSYSPNLYPEIVSSREKINYRTLT